MRILILCLVLLSIATTPLDSFGQPPSGDSEAWRITSFLGERLLGGMVEAAGKIAVEEAWSSSFGSGEERVEELDKRLSTYQDFMDQLANEQGQDREAMRTAAREQRDRIESFRQELGEKTSPQEVRRIVEESLVKMRAKVDVLRSDVGNLEQRAENLEERIVRLENLFGRIPYASPTPLVSNNSGEPKAHPLVLDWMKLLIQSESSRIELAELARLYARSSDRMKEPLKQDEEILASIKLLRKEVTLKFDEAIRQREQLLREFSPKSARMLLFDEEVASLFWLVAVTHPVEGRLGVPPALLGNQASELMIAFDLSGVQPDDINQLYLNELRFKEFEAPVSQVALDPRYSAGMLEVAESLWVLLGVEAPKVHGHWSAVAAEMKQARKLLSPQHPKSVLLSKKFLSFVPKIQELNKEVKNKLRIATEIYLKELRLLRPKHPRMEAYMNGVLRPLVCWTNLTSIPQDVTQAELAAHAEEFIEAEKWVRFYPAFEFIYHGNQSTDVSWDSPGLLTLISRGGIKPDSCKVELLGSDDSIVFSANVDGDVRCTQIGPNQKRFAVFTCLGQKEYEILLFSMEDGRLVNRFKTGTPEGMGSKVFRFTGDGKVLVAGPVGKRVFLIESESGVRQIEFSGRGGISSILGVSYSGDRIVLEHEEEFAIWNTNFAADLPLFVGKNVGDESFKHFDTYSGKLVVAYKTWGRARVRDNNGALEIEDLRLAPEKVWSNPWGLTIASDSKAQSWGANELKSELDFECKLDEILSINMIKNQFIARCDKDKAEEPRGVFRYDFYDLNDGIRLMSLRTDWSFDQGDTRALQPDPAVSERIGVIVSETRYKNGQLPESLKKRFLEGATHGDYVWDFQLPSF